MLTRQQKHDLVATVVAQIKASKSTVVIDYKGLSANDMVALKKSLRSVESPLRIVKKSLLSIALTEAGVDGVTRGILDGQVAIAVGVADEVAGAKAVADFAKDNEAVRIVSGTLGSKLLSADEVIALAKLPSTEQLRGQLVGTLAAPISGFVNVLAGNLRGLVTVLKAVGDTKN